MSEAGVRMCTPAFFVGRMSRLLDAQCFQDLALDVDKEAVFEAGVGVHLDEVYRPDRSASQREVACSVIIVAVYLSH